MLNVEFAVKTAISVMAAALTLGLIGPASAEEWTGLHLTFGLSGTTTDLRSDAIAGDADEDNQDLAPYVAAGYDWAFGDFTIGLLGDVDFGGVTQGDVVSAGKGLYGETDWFATLRARGGMAVSDKWHVYGSGGLALMRTTGTSVNITSGFVIGVDGSETQNLTGTVVGLGAEYLMAPGKHLSFEYLYADFKQSDVFVQDSGSTGRFDPTVSAFRLGYTFRF